MRVIILLVAVAACSGGTKTDASVERRLAALEKASAPEWWCNDLYCTRSEDDCRTFFGQLKAYPKECTRQFIAFCAFNPGDDGKMAATCEPTLSLCQSGNHGVDGRCVGVR